MTGDQVEYAQAFGAAVLTVMVDELADYFEQWTLTPTDACNTRLRYL